MNQSLLESKVKNLKRIILETACKTKEGHIPSAFSILDILYVLYDSVLNVDPKDPEKVDRDYLLVSKGHSAIGLYAVLADQGFFPMSELGTFGHFNSRLGGHPDCNKVLGVEASTGSLGHGLPIAVGMAMGLGYRNEQQRVFCIIGDGELNEGSMWEAILLAGEHKCKNLTCIVDYNHSIDRSIRWGDLTEKFKAFGWETCEVDGHDHMALVEAFQQNDREKPLAVVANTIKGKGCKSMENEPGWHHRSPNEEELAQLLKELEQ